MTDSLLSPSEFIQTKTATDTKTKLILSALVVFCAALVFIRPVPFPLKNPLIAGIGLIGWWLCIGDLKALGLSRSHRIGKTLVWGVLLALIGKFVIGSLLGPVINWLTGTTPDFSSYESFAGNFDAVFGFWWKAMISAGMAEEIIYNAVLLVGISLILSETPFSKHLSIFTTAILFGLAHSAQGAAGIISTGLVGLTFGYGFYLSGRNIYALIIGHCLLDTYAMFVLYYGWYDAGI
jgi:hypothetical protein